MADTEVREALPDRVTMPLLALVTREAVDQDYVQAARRRAERGDEVTPRRTGLRGAAVVTAIFGLLIALAAVQTSRDADVQEASRAALVDRIDERRAEVSGLEERIDDVGRFNASQRDLSGRLRIALGEATVRLRQLEIGTGFVGVGGPGVRMTIEDNPDGGADGRVRATDLRLVVNGFWAAGAEAIAVNGRRLSTRSSLVNANIAVQANGSPLSPPYVVTAIGNRLTLSADLLASASGAEFQSLAEQFGFVVTMDNEDELVIPSAPDSQLRLIWATTGSPTPNDQEEAP
jgi:uncharacterized protein YlxW (UPF0749 family)